MNIDIEREKDDLHSALMISDERCDLIRQAMERIFDHNSKNDDHNISDVLKSGVLQCNNLNEVVYMAYITGTRAREAHQSKGSQITEISSDGDLGKMIIQAIMRVEDKKRGRR